MPIARLAAAINTAVTTPISTYSAATAENIRPRSCAVSTAAIARTTALTTLLHSTSR